MIRPSETLEEFERRQARRAPPDYGRALEIFEALWVEACLLNPDFPAAWEEDIEPDFAVARALNGLPPGA